MKVEDIYNEDSFSVRTLNNELIEDVKENEVETVVPKIDKLVMVLKGKFKKQLGVVKEKERGKEETIVEIQDSFEYVKLGYKEVSEYENHE